MKLPIKNRKGSGELLIPELFGGINLRDSGSKINDNQLSDCLNMWKQDGILKTRPGIKINKYKVTNDDNGNANPGDSKEWWGADIKRHNIYLDYNGCKLQLVSVPCVSVSKATMYSSILFYLVGNGRIYYLPVLNLEIPASSYFIAENKVEKDKFIYCFLNNEKSSLNDEKFSIYKSKLSTDGNWEKIKDSDRYVPIVMAHCNPLGKTTANPNEVTGTMIEGYNIISDYYKIIYNSFNANLITDDESSHIMCYHLLENLNKSKYLGKTVTVKYTSSAGEVTHKVIINSTSNYSEESDYNTDGIKVRVYANRVYFRYKNSSGADAIKYISDGGMDDIEITAPYISDNKEKVFKMSRCEWFGGASAGLAGGTRLFLCGSSSEKNLVLWSGLNNLLYFPENAYFYVGNKSGMVTGFGRQSDKLIIFKENETWLTEYYQNTEITAEDLINQTVVDYTSSSVYFPLTQINPYIGCPYPDTVQLCRNRLVWLADNKKVCTLVTENQYNERSIYTVSEMVQKRLDTEDLSGVSAVDWKGHYCLYIKNKLYLMDYNCYGYTHIASHSKTEDANIKIPWYYWEICRDEILGDIGTALCTDDTLWILNYIAEATILSDKVGAGYFDINRKKDLLGENEVSINTKLATKLFEFSVPHVRKNIERVNFQLGANGGAPITLELITDSGTEQQELLLSGEACDSNDAEYIESCAVFPCIRNVLRLKIKLESNEPMAIDGIIIKYRLVGSVR